MYNYHTIMVNILSQSGSKVMLYTSNIYTQNYPKRKNVPQLRNRFRCSFTVTPLPPHRNVLSVRENGFLNVQSFS